MFYWEGFLRDTVLSQCKLILNLDGKLYERYLNVVNF